MCENPLTFESKIGIFKATTQNGFELHHDSYSYSNTFSTTWSYETSQDPWTAGHTSDVFVVPNLFVAVEKVISVQWNNDRTVCKAILPFKEELVFDLNVPPSEQALAFYSRYHVEAVKIPHMLNAIEIQEKLVDDMNSGKKVCCSNPNEVPCEPKNRIAACSDEEKALELGQLEALKKGNESWNSILNESLHPDTDPLTKWMSGFGMDGMHTETELKLDEQDSLMIPVVTSGLAPNDLIDKADIIDGAVDGSSITEAELNEGIKMAKRVQIVGMIL